jgi:archaellum biogenesis ATPase FlaH
MEFDKKYQASLLKMMITNYDFMVRCGSAIAPDYFDTSRILVAELVKKYWNKYRTLPTERALTDMFEEAIERTSYQKYEKIIRKAFDKLWEEPYPQDGDYIESKLVDFAKSQSYMALAKSIPDLVAVGDYREIEKQNHRIASLGMNTGVVIRSKDAVQDDNLLMNFEAVITIATGIPELDDAEVLDGGIAQKELGIIIAPPNVGKSMMLNSLGNAACMQGKRVYHVTLEMSADQVWKRYVSAIASTSSRLLKSNMKGIKQMVCDFYDGYGGELIIDERPTKKFSPRDLDSELDRMNRMGEMPDLILVDYGDIMKSDANYTQKHENEGEIYVDLRALCTKYNTSMWVPSQGNRGSTGKETIENEDVKGAFDKVATADIIMSINMTKEEYQDGIARINVSKNRRGKKNLTIEIDTKYEHSKFVADIILDANKESEKNSKKVQVHEDSEDEMASKKPKRKKRKKKNSSED